MIGLSLDANANADAEFNSFYVVMTIDNLNLVVPQTHVYALEPILDVSYSDNNFIGHIQVETIVCPVYVLSANLTSVTSISQNRRICVLLHTASPISGVSIEDFFVMPAISDTLDRLPPNLFGLLCDQVVLTEWTQQIKVFPLPACMRTPQTRLRGLILHNDNILCITTAQDLLDCCTTSYLKLPIL